jgi:low affinity Fe/Cu permease
MFKVLDKWFTHAASWIANMSGQPFTFVVAILVVIVWAVTGPVFDYSQSWQLVINTGTSIVTFLMVFLIQNSQNRDTASLHIKLDELISALDGAREQFIGIEHLTSHEIEDVKRQLEQETAGTGRKKGVGKITKTMSNRPELYINVKD